MSYTKRTCIDCGYRDIQPNMVRENRRVHTGRSTTGLQKRTIAAWLFGDKRATNQVTKFLFSPNTREYYRNRTVWVCQSCAGSSTESVELGFFGQLLSDLWWWTKLLITVGVYGAIILYVISLIGEEGSKQKEGKNELGVGSDFYNTEGTDGSNASNN